MAYTVQSIGSMDRSTVENQLGEDFIPVGFAVIRESKLGQRIWSTHKSEALAKAAARRWSMKEVVTR